MCCCTRCDTSQCTNMKICFAGWVNEMQRRWFLKTGNKSIYKRRFMGFYVKSAPSYDIWIARRSGHTRCHCSSWCIRLILMFSYVHICFNAGLNYALSSPLFFMVPIHLGIWKLNLMGVLWVSLDLIFFFSILYDPKNMGFLWWYRTYWEIPDLCKSQF